MQTVLTHSNGVHFAASTGVPAKLATLLRRRPHLVNECDRLGHSPLSYAVLNEDIDSIKVLLGHKASINAPGGDGNTPLHIACAQGNPVVFNSVISSTEEDVDTHAKNCEGQMLLHSAVQGGSLDIVNFLLAFDAQRKTGKAIALQHAPSSDGRPAHIWAVILGREHMFKLLLKAGADLLATDRDGMTPLHWAVQRDEDDIVQLILDQVERCDKKTWTKYVDKRDAAGRTPLIVACQLGRTRIAESLYYRTKVDLEKIDVCGLTPLHNACERGWRDTVESLLAMRASPAKRARNKKQETALEIARRVGREDVIGVLTHELKRLDPKHVGAGTAGLVSTLRDGKEGRAR